METKEKIIAATVAVTVQHGLEGAATAKIAQNAKIAIGTLFHHFPNKQLLLEATYRHILDHYVWHLIGFFDYPDEQVGKQLKKAVRASVDYWVRNWRYFAFTDQMISSHYFTIEIATETRTKMDKHFGQLFKVARKKGFIKKYDSAILLDILFRTIFQSAGLIIGTNKENRDHCRMECLRFIWSAIKP